MAGQDEGRAQPLVPHQATPGTNAVSAPGPAAPVKTSASEAGAAGHDDSGQAVPQKQQVDGVYNATTDPHRLTESPSSEPVSKDVLASLQSLADEVQSGRMEDAASRIQSPPRPTSPISAALGTKDTVEEGVDGEDICRIHKFWLYETGRRFYVVGGDAMERKFRLLKIGRTADTVDLSIAEDDIVYTKKDMNQLLDTLDDGNKASGGMKLRFSFWGLLGFVRFTGAYYMLLVTKKSPVAVIGGHYIYQIDATELIPLTVSSSRSKVDKDPEEARFIGILNNLDLTRSFYFSYSYDVTRTLQQNILLQRHALHADHAESPSKDYNSMFVWNHHFLRPARAVLETAFDWCLPIIHGYVDQAKISDFGRSAYITMIARRSRFYAGARFLKRGANDLGYVANDVESEQIVSQMLSTSFHAPGPEPFASPNYTSYVQHRGSIPLYWTQDSSGVSPKPDIECRFGGPPTMAALTREVNLIDPFYSAAALHFDDLFMRYGSPIFVLNLVKSRERTPRESILLQEYGNAISYLNQFLPDSRKICYKAWDMSRASKSHDQDVIGTLESIAEDVMTLTGFFRNATTDSGDFRIQSGVARTNCIDCLDRTNAAQFVIGKRALGHQLQALGYIDDASIAYDTDAVNLFTHMFHNHGDTIAVQYGGSHLVNTMETYRKINQWSSQSQNMVESFKRYYNNSFLDKQRQEAYNLFLGNYIFAQGQPMLWDLSTDYYLHHADPRAWFAQRRRSYQEWFTPENLLAPGMPDASKPQAIIPNKPLSSLDEWWIEYYRPHQLSDFRKMFPLKMRSADRDENKESNDRKSPFRIRHEQETSSPRKPLLKKGVTIAGPTVRPSQDNTSTLARNQQSPLQHEIEKGFALEAKEGDSVNGKAMKERKGLKDKSIATQWTLDQFVTNSLNPSVADTEAHEYQRYVNHPLNLPLVVSTKIPPNANTELLSYANSVSVDAATNVLSTEDDVIDYVAFLDVGEEPLTVTEADTAKKRYKAYRQWVKGKSLFKQRVDP